MRSRKQLHHELQFVTEFSVLLDVLQQSAMAQLRHTEERLGRMPLLMERIRREFFPLVPSWARQQWALRGGAKGRLMVVITSDEGFVGPLHAAAIHAAQRRADGEAEWVFVGQRGWRMLEGQPGMTRRGVSQAAPQVIPIPPEERTAEQMARLRQFIVTAYRTRTLRDAWVVAPRYRSATRQDVVVQQLLPLPVPPPTREEPRLVIEPTMARVMERLAEVWVETACFEMFQSARRAEFAARAMHVEAARQELGRRSRAVRHEWFKMMHEHMDVLVRETCVVQRQVSRRAARQHLERVTG